MTLVLYRCDLKVAEMIVCILEVTAPHELGLPALGLYNWPNLYPVYVRGEAYLAAHRGSEAAKEFQKILDHRGIVLNEPIGALAHLQLGRAYAMAGDTAKARIVRISSPSGKTPILTFPS